MTDDFFGAPPEGAITSTNIEFLKVAYKSLKTPEPYASAATTQVIEQNRQLCKVGFSYYDKETKLNVAIDNFAFAVLEVYSGVSGFVKDGDTQYNYWSPLVKDTRSEPIRLYEGERLIVEGIYRDIKEKLPNGAKFHVNVIAYCLPLDRIIRIELTQSVSRAMQRAIAEAESAIGRKKKADDISLFGICDNDHIWGFRFTEFIRETKEGKQYEGKGELFFNPEFKCGVIQPLDKTKELHAKCVDLQKTVREDYRSKKEKYSKKAEPAPVNNWPPKEEEFAAPPVSGFNGDDLPF